MGDLENRVVVLETMVEAQEKREDERAASIAEILKTVQEIHVRLAAQRPCPAPGLCLELKARMVNVEASTKALELVKASASGSVNVLNRVLTLLAGGVGLWVIQLIVQALKKMP